MYRFAFVTIVALLAISAVAQDAQTPAPQDQTAAAAAPAAPAREPDPAVAEQTESIAHDLRTLGRVTEVARDLDDSRQVLLAIIDADVERLRGPREDGTYQWAALQREEGGRITDEKPIELVHTEKDLKNVTVTGAHGYRVVVTVPPKRRLLSGNNRVWIRNLLVDSTGFDGKTTHQEIPVNAWVNPGDANGVALADISKSVKVTAELGVESGSRKAVAEVALIQAKLVDDPNSPWYPAIKRFLQIRQFAAAEDMNRGYLKNAIDEALLALPGELEKRTAQQLAAAEERKRLALTGETRGAIALGDATPDVVKELDEIDRMLRGTLQEQTDGRARLEALRLTLAPKPVETTATPAPVEPKK